MTRSGQCMCGAVKFTGNPLKEHAACYCKMCQRWASGMFVGIRTMDFEVTEGAEHLTVFDSSDWANRAFCSTCGSNIYYALKGEAHVSVALGAYDDTDDLPVAQVFFADKKPATLDLAGDPKMLTEAEIMKEFGP